MSGKSAKRANAAAMAQSRRAEQQGNEDTMRARQKGERGAGGGGRGRNMLEGRLSGLLKSKLGGGTE